MNLSIKDVPEALVARLRERAARNHRSLQGELMAIVEQASAMALQPGTATGSTPALPFAPVQSADVMHMGWKTVEQLMAERKASGWKPDPKMALLPRGVDIIRADRDAR